MHNPPRILVVDDNETNRDILVTRLATQGYELSQAADGEEALAAAQGAAPDLILLDVMMPKIDGIEVCRRLKADASLPFMPIILVTAKADTKDVVAGLEAGADEYLTKPIDQMALVARVKSVLRMKELHDQVAGAGRRPRRLEPDAGSSASPSSWPRSSASAGSSDFSRRRSPSSFCHRATSTMLESHRARYRVVFCDLRGFTAFAETAEPEEVMAVLREYHAALGALIHKHEGTLEHFAGDGVMVLFNDPLPCPDPNERAVRMAVEMRDEVAGLGEASGARPATNWVSAWASRTAMPRSGASASRAASTIRRSARWSISRRGYAPRRRTARSWSTARCRRPSSNRLGTEPAGELTLKGFHRPIRAFNICALSPTTA